ncbi:uncharacterized protein MONBRDRAFT_28602 [Monosiga brevicollis MX1]|uniref:Non-specific protein-tyrosine kinase n=1 Tax=Monosiga brevicollis TaxID=81824 RepID=A9V8N2_MONBE|nr:uncharacterized protein MONBRDRAFT_28602 [Monosiga brevicollis MX1]EDQ86114.1 predicted protein [Monosiga brevicollis MX1]|eukprot:XP_001749039.1 hypothetical protein [Monosiga brevicollis MX1]
MPREQRTVRLQRMTAQPFGVEFKGDKDAVVVRVRKGEPADVCRLSKVLCALCRCIARPPCLRILLTRYSFSQVAGLRIGDRIVFVNNRSVVDWPHLTIVREIKNSGLAVDLTVVSDMERYKAICGSPSVARRTTEGASNSRRPSTHNAHASPKVEHHPSSSQLMAQSLHGSPVARRDSTSAQSSRTPAARHEHDYPLTIYLIFCIITLFLPKVALLGVCPALLPPQGQWSFLHVSHACNEIVTARANSSYSSPMFQSPYEYLTEQLMRQPLMHSSSAHGESPARLYRTTPAADLHTSQFVVVVRAESDDYLIFLFDGSSRSIVPSLASMAGLPFSPARGNLTGATRAASLSNPPQYPGKPGATPHHQGRRGGSQSTPFVQGVISPQRTHSLSSDRPTPPPGPVFDDAPLMPAAVATPGRLDNASILAEASDSFVGPSSPRSEATVAINATQLPTSASKTAARRLARRSQATLSPLSARPSLSSEPVALAAAAVAAASISIPAKSAADQPMQADQVFVDRHNDPEAFLGDVAALARVDMARRYTTSRIVYRFGHVQLKRCEVNRRSVWALCFERANLPLYPSSTMPSRPSLLSLAENAEDLTTEAQALLTGFHGLSFLYVAGAPLLGLEAYFLTSAADDTSLFEMLNAHRRGTSSSLLETEAERHRLCLEIAGGVSTLHELKLLHGSLSPHFIAIDAAGDAKILGYALPYLAVQALNAVNVARYAAPEVLTNKAAVSQAGDAYSLGVIIAEVASGGVQLCPEADSMDDLVRKICVQGACPAKPAGMPDELASMWERDPELRCGADDLQIMLMDAESEEDESDEETAFNLKMAQRSTSSRERAQRGTAANSASVINSSASRRASSSSKPQLAPASIVPHTPDADAIILRGMSAITLEELAERHQTVNSDEDVAHPRGQRASVSSLASSPLPPLALERGMHSGNRAGRMSDSERLVSLIRNKETDDVESDDSDEDDAPGLLPSTTEVPSRPMSETSQASSAVGSSALKVQGGDWTPLPVVLDEEPENDPVVEHAASKAIDEDGSAYISESDQEALVRTVQQNLDLSSDQLDDVYIDGNDVEPGTLNSLLNVPGTHAQSSSLAEEIHASPSSTEMAGDVSIERPPPTGQAQTVAEPFRGVQLPEHAKQEAAGSASKSETPNQAKPQETSASATAEANVAEEDDDDDFFALLNKHKNKVEAKTRAWRPEDEAPENMDAFDDLEGPDRWAKHFNLLLLDDEGFTLFLDFMKTIHCEENGRFFRDVEAMRKLPESQAQADIERIYNQYFVAGSRQSLNVEPGNLASVQAGMKQTPKPTSTFSAAQKEVYWLMRRDTYPRFLDSKLFKKAASKWKKNQGKATKKTKKDSKGNKDPKPTSSEAPILPGTDCPPVDASHQVEHQVPGSSGSQDPNGANDMSESKRSVKVEPLDEGKEEVFETELPTAPPPLSPREERRSTRIMRRLTFWGRKGKDGKSTGEPGSGSQEHLNDLGDASRTPPFTTDVDTDDDEQEPARERNRVRDRSASGGSSLRPPQRRLFQVLFPNGSSSQVSVLPGLDLQAVLRDAFVRHGISLDSHRVVVAANAGELEVALDRDSSDFEGLELRVQNVDEEPEAEQTKISYVRSVSSGSAHSVDAEVSFV